VGVHVGCLGLGLLMLSVGLRGCLGALMNNPNYASSATEQTVLSTLGRISEHQTHSLGMIVV
jgi:hypothetical protein